MTNDAKNRLIAQAYLPEGSVIPDYFTDRNALHEAERKLIGTLHSKRHAEILQGLTGLYCVGITPDHDRDMIYLSRITRVPTDQMAEILGITLKLWNQGQ